MDGGLSATLPTPKWGDSSAVTQRPPSCRRGGGPRRASAPWLQQQRPAPTAGRRRCAPRSRSHSSPAGFDGGFYERGGLKMSRITALSPPSSPPDPPRPAQRSARAAAPPAAPPSPAAPAAAPRAASPPPAPAPTARPQPGGHKIGGGRISKPQGKHSYGGEGGSCPPSWGAQSSHSPPPLLSPTPLFPFGSPFLSPPPAALNPTPAQFHHPSQSLPSSPPQVPQPLPNPYNQPPLIPPNPYHQPSPPQLLTPPPPLPVSF